MMMQVKFLDGTKTKFQPETVGARLDAVRRRFDLTQGQMAEIMAISRTSYVHYSHDKRDLPLSLAKIVIKHFQLDSEWFLFGDEERRTASNKGAE